MTALNSRQVWSMLDKYHDLRGEWPLPSALGNVGGGSRTSSAGVTPKVAFVIDVGVVLSKLTWDEYTAVAKAHEARMTIDRANAEARNAEREARMTTIGEMRGRRRARLMMCRQIASDGEKELHRIRNRVAFRAAMPKLCALLEVIHEERFGKVMGETA